MPETTGAAVLAQSLKQQGVEYMFGIVGFPVTAYCRLRPARGHPVLRHAQRAGGVLRRAGRRLPDRPAGRPPRRLRARHDPRHRRPRQRLVELLADDPHRRRVGRLAERHGRVPGGAAGRGRAAVHQVRARGRNRVERIPYYVEQAVRTVALRPPRRRLPRPARRHHRRRRSTTTQVPAAPTRPGAAAHAGTDRRRSTPRSPR